MDYILPAFALIIAVAAWFIFKSRLELAYKKGKTEQQAETATLTERLAGKESQLGELKALLDKGAGEILALRGELKAEAEKRAAAEEKNSRIAELGSALKTREE